MFCTFSDTQEPDFYAQIRGILAQVSKLDDKLYGLRYTLKTVKDIAFRKTLLEKIETIELERATLLKERDTLNALLRRKIDEEKAKAPEERKTTEVMKAEALQEAKQVNVQLTEPEVKQVLAVKVDPVLKQIEPEILKIVEEKPENIGYVADLLTEKTFEKVVAEIERKAAAPEQVPQEVEAASVEPVKAGFSIDKIALIAIAVASLFTAFGRKK